MYIQYVGFDSSDGFRVYAFHVIDATEEARDFTVRVQSAAFRPGGLKFQDGPDICFARLEQELQKRMPVVGAEAHLSIGEPEVQEYVKHHDPQRLKRKKTEERDMQATDDPKDMWRRQ